MKVKIINKKENFNPITIKIKFESLEEIKYTHEVLGAGDDRKTGKIYDALSEIIDNHND